MAGPGMRTHDALSVARDGAVLQVSFIRPERLNAVTADGLDDLADLLQEAAEDTEVRVVVLSGEGRAFSSGADLQGDVSEGPDDRPGVATLMAANRVVRALRGMPQPTIAAVNGPAAGVGCSLALACDLVVAAESAYFLLAFSRIGLMPDGGASATVAASVGRARAMRMALLAEALPAPEAFDAGLVTHLAPDDSFPSLVDTLVRRLAAGPPLALAASKKAANAATLPHLD